MSTASHPKLLFVSIGNQMWGGVGCGGAEPQSTSVFSEPWCASHHPVGPPLLQLYQESSPFLLPLPLLFLLPFFEPFNLTPPVLTTFPFFHIVSNSSFETELPEKWVYSWAAEGKVRGWGIRTAWLLGS